MSLGAGPIYQLGFRFALKGPNDPVMPASSASIPAYLHFVDAAGATIAPTLVAGGLSTPEGPVAGLRWQVASGANLATTNQNVTNLSMDVDQVESAVDKLRAGGEWAPSDVYTVAVDGETATAMIGSFNRVNAEALGAGEWLNVALPPADEGNVGRRVGVGDVSGFDVSATASSSFGVRLTSDRPIDGAASPYPLAGVRPRVVLTCVKTSEEPEEYAWIVESERREA